MACMMKGSVWRQLLNSTDLYFISGNGIFLSVWQTHTHTQKQRQQSTWWNVDDCPVHCQANVDHDRTSATTRCWNRVKLSIGRHRHEDDIMNSSIDNTEQTAKTLADVTTTGHAQYRTWCNQTDLHLPRSTKPSGGGRGSGQQTCLGTSPTRVSAASSAATSVHRTGRVTAARRLPSPLRGCGCTAYDWSHTDSRDTSGSRPSDEHQPTDVRDNWHTSGDHLYTAIHTQTTTTSYYTYIFL